MAKPKTNKRIVFSKIIVMHAIPRHPTPPRGWFRRNYPTQKLRRNMFPAGPIGNRHFQQQQAIRNRPRTPRHRLPGNSAAALNAALRSAQTLLRQIRRNNNSNSSNSNSSRNNLYR